MNSLNQFTNNAVMILMVSAIDRSIGVAGATLSCTLSKAGGAFSAIAPSIVDRGLGWYAVSLTTADTNTVGQLVLHAEASGCDHSDLVFDIVARNRATKLLA
jgi:hypothetical protein